MHQKCDITATNFNTINKMDTFKDFRCIALHDDIWEQLFSRYILNIDLIDHQWTHNILNRSQRPLLDSQHTEYRSHRPSMDSQHTERRSQRPSMDTRNPSYSEWRSWS